MVVALQRLVTCGHCLEVKASGEFSYVAVRRGVSVCRSCNNERQKAAYKAKPEQAARRKVRMAAAPLLYMVRSLRGRAKHEGIPFDLTVDDVFLPEHCPVLGVKLAAARGQGNRTEAAPSFDRLDSSKGYVRGNVWIISMRANRIKSNGSAEEHERIAAWMRAQHVTSEGFQS